MKKLTVGLQRLKKLADHLENGKLGHKIFTFRYYNTGFKDEEHNKCGTMGCALGECPILFKKSWNFNYRGLPVIKEYVKHKYMGAVDSAMKFFQLSNYDAMCLFIPEAYNRNPEIEGFKTLDDKATRKQVARNIRKFIEYKRK